MNRKCHAVIFLVLITVFGDPNVLPAESLKELPGVMWQRHFGDKKFWYTAAAMALSHDGGIWITGTSSLAGGSGESGSFWIWKLNKNGNQVKEIQVESPYKVGRLNPTYSYIKTLVELQDGTVLLVVEFMEGQPSIVKINTDGKILFLKAIGQPDEHIVISKVIQTSDKHLLLVGSKNLDAVLIKVDGAGRSILWDKTIDRGQMDSFIAGLPLEGGGSILIGNSGTYDQFDVGPSNVWVAKFDSKGKIQSEKVFLGRYGSVSNGADGGYAIVYDKSGSRRQDIWVQFLTADFKDSREAQLLAIERGTFSGFKIAPVSSGGFIVAGSKELKLWVSRVDASAKVIWNVVDDGQNKSWKCNDLIFSNDQFFMLFPVYSENEKRQLNTKVGIVKFIQK